MNDLITMNTIWAQNGGLPALVILALFCVLMVAIYSAKYVAQAWRDELCKLMDMHQAERGRWATLMDTRQQETNEVIRGLTAVIGELASRTRRYDRDPD